MVHVVFECVYNFVGEVQVFEGGKWKGVVPGEEQRLSQLEGQVWLTLFTLLMDRDCQGKYELNNHSKATILKVCKL